MLYSLAAFALVYLAIWIYDLKNYAMLSKNMLCSTLIYIVPSGLNCLISAGTIVIGFFIRSKLEPYIYRQREVIEQSENKNEISV